MYQITLFVVRRLFAECCLGQSFFRVRILFSKRKQMSLLFSFNQHRAYLDRSRCCFRKELSLIYLKESILLRRWVKRYLDNKLCVSLCDLAKL